MKTFLLFFCSTSFAFYSGEINSQNTKIEIKQDKILSVDEVFDIIQNQTDLTFVYRVGMFANYPNVTLKKGTIQVDELLDKSLKNGNLNIILTANNTILIKEKPALQQEIKITGTITDADGLELAGATVFIKGTNIGATADFDGKYSITVFDKANILEFAHLGAEVVEVLVGDKKVINVVIDHYVNQLNEIVVQGGYYETSRLESTGNIGKLSSDEITKQPINNIIGTLQGRLAGVEIRQTSGVPGSGFTIKIRGDNSLLGGDPLYIVDGTPLNNVNRPEGFASQSILPTGSVSPLEGINPNDIESIEVLKDADATAIYGSRGANGVVLLTTKKGKAGKTVFDVNAFTGMTYLTRRKSYLNTAQHLELRREAFANDQAYDAENGFPLTEPFPTDYDLNGVFSETKFTDWQDVILGNTGRSDNVQIAVSGGGEQTRFRIGGGVSNEVPTFVGFDNKYKKYSVQTNVSHSSKNGRFRIGLNTSYVSSEANYSANDFVFDLPRLAPNANDLLDADGNLVYIDPEDENIFRSLFNNFNTISNNLLASTNIEYEISPRLTLKANLGYNKSDDRQSNTDKASIRNPLGFEGTDPANSLLLLSGSQTSSWNFEPQLNWSSYVGPGLLSALVGATWNERSFTISSTEGFGFADDTFINNISAANEVNIDSGQTPYAYSAYFGRIGYNINDKYIINVSGRRDGSSRFGANNRFSSFGSVGAAWVFSQEGFLKENSVLTFGKLRASYGRTGSDNIGDFQYLETFGNSTIPYSGVRSRTPSNLANANFSWEGVNKFEVGLSLGFFNDRINFDTSFYQNRTTNQLIEQPLPATTGFSGIQINLPAVIQNQGLEFELTTKNIQNDNFSWSTNFNITIPENELIEFPNLEQNNSFRNQLVIGESINVLRLYEFTGVDPQTGLYTFTDFDESGDIEIEGIGDRRALVNPDPQFYGGLTNNINYKNFSLGFTFQFVKRTGDIDFRNSVVGPSAHTTDLLDRWQNPGDIATRQVLITPQSNNRDANLRDFYFAESNGVYNDDLSFIRLQNLSVGYTVPKKVTNIVKARVYIQAQNLVTFTNYTGWDPDSASPLYRTITFGSQFTF